MSTRIEQGSGDLSPRKGNTGSKPVEREEDLSLFMKGDDKKLTREVNGEQREIRVGHDKQGDKFRYTDDTKEELVATSKKGKNKYLTKSEFDKQIKKMLHINYLPETIRAEYRDGNIIFINNETNETMTAQELRANPEIIALQERKINDDYFAEQDKIHFAELKNTSILPDAVKVSDLMDPAAMEADFARIKAENKEKMKAEAVIRYEKEQAALSENISEFKVDPNWYTSEGVSILQRDWSKYASAKKGFTREFYQGIVDLAKDIKCDPDHIMTVIQSESGFNPAAINSRSGASGLVQIMPDIAPSLGTTVEDIRKMSPTEQLPYIRACFSGGRDIIMGKNSQLPMSGGLVYGAIYLPGGTRDALVKRGDGILSRKGHPYYDANTILDFDGDKKITVADLDTYVAMLNKGSRAQFEYKAEDDLPEIVVTSTRRQKPEDEQIAKGKPTEVPGKKKVAEGEQPKPITPQDTEKQGNTHIT